MARGRYELSGKTVLVTGAAKGIGAGTARELDRRGARLSLVDLDGAELERTAADLASAEPFRADVTDFEALEQVAAETAERFGGIDIVMANAGIAAPGLIELQDRAEFERVVEVNLLGVYRTVKATLPYVLERRGYVLVVASLAAPLHAPAMGQYSMAKAGVEALGNTLRLELAGTGTSVGVAYFGYIDTPMVAGSLAIDPGLRELRDSGGPLASRTAPIEGAAAAVVSGIERRASIVAYPRWTRPLLSARGIVQPLLNRHARGARVRAILDGMRARGAGQDSMPRHVDERSEVRS